MLLKIYEDNNDKQIAKVVDVLKKGGLIIYPTDTIYGLGCDITNHRALERLYALKNVKAEKANFSFVCHDLSNIADYTRPIDTVIFRMLKKALPGPFTFVLNANNSVPKLLSNKRKTVGIRVPDNTICRKIVAELGNPIISTSIRDDDEVLEYSTDPELIYEKYRDTVDIVIDAGFGDNEASTVIDCTGPEPELIRAGKGDFNAII